MSIAQWTVRKSLEDLASGAEEHGPSSLTKTLGPWSLVGLGIGCIIGAGIFVLTGNQRPVTLGRRSLCSYSPVSPAPLSGSAMQRWRR